MLFYLCSRYSRRDEMQQLRGRLQEFGHVCVSRWLDSTWLMTDTAEMSAAHCPVEFRDEGAVEDMKDVAACDILLAFTEPNGSPFGRGGRHTEFGAALALGKRLAVIGYRENIFHYHPKVEFFQTTDEMIAEIFG